MISASGKSYSCGGSLLSKDVVLTAAHCLYEEKIHAPYSAEKIHVSAGSKKNIFLNKNMRKAKSIHPHPDYKNEIFNYIHDIGIIVLSSPFNDRISKPIHISKRDVEKQTKLIALGWGRTDPENLKGPTSFLQVELADDDSKICKNRIPKWVSDAQICLIVKENKDTCKGDSGGPLIYRHGNVNTLIGITSYGNGIEKNAPICGSNGGVSVFVHSYNYLKWISDITKISEEDLLTAQYDPSDAPSSAVSASLIAGGCSALLLGCGCGCLVRLSI
ncbi:Trypsin-4 [Zancudomyces culisetae]|uniref:Trypsin-4 n=1 Tax=Zancudomyces culisetae TaxID=1213189 RepID=A0A1R1PS28_ZANCU|nr:Trypsin-4 [Zancudomyces culisetae]|eukprot:OMH83693.1 Trypsin-4 [Zancudomyces culisetae]